MVPITQSQTTQNVAMGTAGTGGGLVAIAVWMRAMGWLPWPVEADAAVITVITTVIGPLVSRALAAWRDPAKKALPFIGLCLCCALAFSGCASNRAAFVEDLYDGATGNMTAHTTYTGGQLVTVGSKLPVGVTELLYQGQGKNPWSLTIGANEKGMEAAGDPVQIITAIMPLIEMITQMQLALAPQKAAAEAVKADAESARLDALILGLDKLLAAKSVTGATK